MRFRPVTTCDLPALPPACDLSAPCLPLPCLLALPLLGLQGPYWATQIPDTGEKAPSSPYKPRSGLDPADVPIGHDNRSCWLLGALLAQWGALLHAHARGGGAPQ
jgi:hypothetical protein